MIVVADTTPLHYLLLVQAIDVLPRLYGAVLIPPTVAAELSHPGAPQAVREWIADRPAWVKVQAPRSAPPVARLGPGETAAIALALEVKADLLLIDDRSGKRAAQELGVHVVGTLAVLDAAAARGFVDFAAVVHDLETRTNFRMSRALRDRLLKEHADPATGRPATEDQPPANPREP